MFGYFIVVNCTHLLSHSMLIVLLLMCSRYWIVSISTVTVKLKIRAFAWAQTTSKSEESTIPNKPSAHIPAQRSISARFDSYCYFLFLLLPSYGFCEDLLVTRPNLEFLRLNHSNCVYATAWRLYVTFVWASARRRSQQSLWCAVTITSDQVSIAKLQILTAQIATGQRS